MERHRGRRHRPDLLRFGLAHAGGTSALPAEALAAGHRPTAPWPGADGYGIGWGVQRHGDLSIAFHGGSMGGVARRRLRGTSH
ncbi:hypothetical protein OG884_24710 [Streptosporangium sp. NBC_01755]|uniref:hypothetical protein n=1 Tax=unclassified Streptosporangium TaxID=2632669 RepID=UPI002DDB0741|nr:MULTISPECIES: hypothetical protein [unclassified Streptosporangium]WSA23850.1 hypothetical protein OIE13_23205 [Streptosporangium sp. NBC_01810]WSC98077.1 hypothetical protein OG884_24710 [Streptosporangium sp. NBC_01755]